MNMHICYAYIYMCVIKYSYVIELSVIDFIQILKNSFSS